VKTRRLRKSLWFLVASEVTVAAHLLLFLPPVAQAATPVAVESVREESGEAALALLRVEPSSSTPPEPVQVNKTVPQVEPPPQYPTFSPIPTDEELFHARVFGEPLIPEAGERNDAENQALGQAITTYLYGGDSEALEPLEGVVTAFPNSRWRVAVQANVGSWYRKKHYFTRAQRNLTEAWSLGKDSKTEGVRKLAEFAAGELMLLHMQFGQVDPLEALVGEFAGREVSGGITETLDSAQAAVWGLRNDHEKAIPSGSVALERLRLDKHEKKEKAEKNKNPQYKKKAFQRAPALDAFPATMNGASLAQILDLADLTDLKLQMAKREDPNAEIPIPSLVHLKQGHFSALVEKRGERFRFDDPLLGGEVWLSRQAFEEEISGFFLIEQGPVPQGWRVPGRNEASPIRGKCVYAFADEDDTGDEDDQSPDGDDPDDDDPDGNDPDNPDGDNPDNPDGGDPDCLTGMPRYNFHTLLASLHIYDVPLGCSAPIGPSTFFKVTYNQREATQPQTFTFSNLGPRWSFGWLSYIEDDPSAIGEPVELYQRGGGRQTYEGFDGGVSAPQSDVRAILEIVSTSPIVYERHLANGSVEVFSQTDGAATAPRKVFLTQRQDSAGNTLTFTYDGQLRLVSATDAIGRVSTVSYELEGDPLKVTKVTDPYDRTATFEYDDSGQLARITDVIGMSSTFQYGQNNIGTVVTYDFIRSMTTPYGTTIFQSGKGPYNTTTNRWVQATDPLGGRQRDEYLLNSAPVSATDGANTVPTGFTGNANLNTHLGVYYSKVVMDRQTADPPDPNDGVITKFRSSQTLTISGYQFQSRKRPLENRVWYEHVGETITNGVGPDGRPARIGRVLDDGTSQIHRFEYNQVGKHIRYTDPADREYVLIYGTGTTPDAEPPAGTGLDLLEVRHKNGGVYETLAERTYNSQHRVLTATDAVGKTSSFTYNPEGQLLTATSPPTTNAPEGATTSLSYDTDGYLLSLTGPVSASTTTYTYDDFGRVETVSPPLQDAVTFDYDGLDRVTQVTYEDGTYEQVVYNRLDAERVRDRLGRWSHLRYDALRRPTGSTDAEGRTLTFQWCSCGVLESLLDGNGNRTSWEYDLEGRVTKETRANGAEIDYTYEDTTSRLETVTDPRSIVSTLEYFVDNRLKKKSYSDSTPDLTFTYDNRGRASTAANGTDTLSWTYDLTGRLLLESSAKNSSTVSYTYDEVGNRRTASLDGTPFVAYDYDSALRLKSITRGSNVFSFGYDVASRRTSMTYPNGIATTYAYDTESRLSRITAKLDTTVVTDFQYSYNAVGNRTQKVTPDLTETYEYDRVDQLVGVVRTGTAANRWHYAYDPAGNRTTEQTGDAPVQASYDNMNRLLSTSAGGSLLFKGSLNEAATVTIDGNPAEVDSSNTFQGTVESTSGTNTVTVVATDPSSNTRTNTYEVEVSGSGVSYDYDASGNLIEKDDGTDTWTYEWNAENQLIEVLKNAVSVATFAYDPLGRRVEKVANPTTTTFTYDSEDILREIAGATTTYYVHGPGIDEPLAKESSGSTTYYHADVLDSIAKMTDAAGDVTHEYRYDSWGRIETGGSQSGYAFTGREWDPEISSYYYRARYYDPEQGRFLNEDPIGLEGGWNLFQYVDANPVNLVDPFGRLAGGSILAQAAARTAARTAAGWGVALVEPSPAGEVVMGIVTTGLLAYDIYEIYNAHRKGARKSTEDPHQKGVKRLKKDKGGEKGDERRRQIGKRPKKWRGPWPPPDSCP
jgi:RHS repeat-associated protein